MTDYEHILYEPRGAVALITLNRPQKLNAWTQTMENEFIDAVKRASADAEVGCIVVTGAGRGFCAGADIGGWDERLQGRGDGRVSPDSRFRGDARPVPRPMQARCKGVAPSGGTGPIAVA